MAVLEVAVRYIAGVLLGAIMAVVEALWVAIAVVMHAFPRRPRWLARGTRWLVRRARGRVNRYLGGAIAVGPVGSRALAYLAARSVVGGLGGGGFLLVGVWVGLSWYALSGGSVRRAAMSWYDPITWVVFVLIVAFLAAQALIGLVALERRLAVWGLSPSDNEILRRRVDLLSRAREQVLEAVHDERRRIERDLHDGVQQRLVVLGVLLGRARRGGDPRVSAELIRQAHNESRGALEELREVAWRIHPVALDDGGLHAALDALAERCSVPVGVDYSLDRRVSPAQETVAYFTVSEAVTNALKHGRAQRIEIGIHRIDTMLAVQVVDDGIGGARSDGRGLSGLARRVAAVDGRIRIDSPAGGPTTLRVEVPCE